MKDKSSASLIYSVPKVSDKGLISKISADWFCLKVI